MGLGFTNADVNNPNVLHPAPAPVERHLAFHLQVQPEQLLLDPRRLALPQATLVREEPASNLVPASSEFRLALTLDTSLSGTQGPTASVNNLAVPDAGRPYNGFVASSARPGRGVLAAVGSPCGGLLADQDHHVLAILRRSLRVIVEDLDDGCSSCAFHAPDEISLFRGEGAHEYRFNVFPYRHKGARLGQIEGRVVVDWDAEGRLTAGTLEVFGRCAGGQTRSCSETPVDVLVYLGPPGFAGVSHPPVQELGFVSVPYLAALGQGGSVAVPFGTLLSRSTWNQPR